MTRFPGLEAKILKTLEEEGEMRPPQGALARQWFWQAASQLQARGLAVADQRAGLVRSARTTVSVEDKRLLDGRSLADSRAAEVPWRDNAVCERCGQVFRAHWMPHGAIPPGGATAACAGFRSGEVDFLARAQPLRETDSIDRRPAPATDLNARLRILLRRWRAQETAQGGAEGSVFGQCANDLQEAMEECGVAL